MVKKGYKQSEEHKQKLRLANLGKKRSDKFKEYCCNRKGPAVSNWKPDGYSYIDKQGYCQIKINGKFIAEHHYVWIKAHRQLIPKGYIIHHINEKRDDNRIENLQLITRTKHTKYHRFLKLKTLKKGILIRQRFVQDNYINMTYADLAKKFNVNPHTIWCDLKQMNFKLCKNGQS